MTTLAKDTPREYELGDVNDLPVVATDIIYEGAAVGENGSGYSRPLVAGDPFQGFALKKADNSTGAAGDINVKVQKRGYIKLTVAGATAITANDHPPVYASDDATFTLTASTNTLIGNVSRWISSGVCIVYFDTPRPPSTVGTTDIENDAVTLAKMADLAQGSLISGQAANAPGALDASGDGYILIGDGTDINSVAVSGDVTITNAGVVAIGADKITNAMIGDGQISLEHLDAAAKPSHIVVFADDEYTTTGGGAAEAISVAGVLATDHAYVTLQDDGTNNVSVKYAICTTDTLTVTFSGDPAGDTIINYIIVRAAA